MIILNRKKKIKRLQEITERQEKQVRSLNSWLETFLAKENEIRKEYSINLEKVNEIKRKLDSISDFNLYEKCECFNKKFKIDLKTTECKYREFNDEKDVEMWADNLYKDWSERIKEFRLNLYIYKIFPCDWHNHLNSDTTAIEMYCGYPYKQMNMILRKLYNERIEAIPSYEQLCNVLMCEMLSAPRIDENIVLYRFIDDIAFGQIMKALNENGHYKELGFMSASLLKKIDDSGVPEPYSNSSYVLKLYVKKDSIGVFSSILAGRNFEHEIILPCGGVIEPLKTPSVDDSIGKIVLECTYSGNKQINQIVI